MTTNNKEKKKSQTGAKLENFSYGDQIKVHFRIKEGESERVQVFEGVVIRKRGSGKSRTFTVRKTSFGVGVERIFPLKSPLIEKIEVVKPGHVRRAKLYYLRKLAGKAARITREEGTLEENQAEVTPVAGAPEQEPQQEKTVSSGEKPTDTKTS